MQLGKEIVVGEVECGVRSCVRQGGVERNNVALREEFLQRHKAFISAKPFGLLSGRVATQYMESPTAGIVGHKRADVPHANDTQSALLRRPPFLLGKVG